MRVNKSHRERVNALKFVGVVMDECLIFQRTYSKTKLKKIQSDHLSRISRSPNSRISRSGPGWFFQQS